MPKLKALLARLAGFRGYLPDTLFFGGLISVGRGLYILHPAACLIIMGAAGVFMGFCANRNAEIDEMKAKYDRKEIP